MTARTWLHTSLACLGAGVALLLCRPSPTPVHAAPAEPVHPSAFKITFGARNPTNGRIWSGGVRNGGQLRGLHGWHLGSDDAIVAPDRWNITLDAVGGDVAPKAVILDLVTPEEQPVTAFTRYGDFTFVPAEIQWGKPEPVKPFNGDVTVERVPSAQVATTPELEDDDPSILRTRAGDYWLAWVAYRTQRRNGNLYTGGDQIMVARGRDGGRWFGAEAITPPGDHFRVALAEDARGRIWCVYAAQKQSETGNFDLYARRFDSAAWSAEEKLTTSPMPDIFHRLVSGKNGNLYLVWMSYRPSPNPGGTPQSDILLRVFSGDAWGKEVEVTRSADDDWEPSVAVDSTESEPGVPIRRVRSPTDPMRGPSTAWSHCSPP